MEPARFPVSQPNLTTARLLLRPFTPAGEHDLKWGVYEDVKVHAILAREWAARRAH